MEDVALFQYTGGTTGVPKAAMLTHFNLNQKVLEAAVAGVPHEYRGETVKAYIVLKEGQNATAEEIIDFCRERLAPYKVPKLVEFRQELPKTAVGKLLKRKLVDDEKQKAATC
ncbi:AMP-binding enzyme [Desulfurispora thermophila]|uniref:AMP-binding enzyme n=1 Tax=Desulfurispora thermophila TaxID=265470 RepID=UPI00036DB492|nr:AMP-binding protein [Desulfurispora thermophila]